MINNLDYQSNYCSINPGLWILITDEEEESIKKINEFIADSIV